MNYITKAIETLTEDIQLQKWEAVAQYSDGEPDKVLGTVTTTLDASKKVAFDKAAVKWLKGKASIGWKLVVRKVKSKGLQTEGYKPLVKDNEQTRKVDELKKKGFSIAIWEKEFVAMTDKNGNPAEVYPDGSVKYPKKR